MAVITEQQINIINRRGRGKHGQLFQLKLPPLSTSAFHKRLDEEPYREESMDLGMRIKKGILKSYISSILENDLRDQA